MFYRRKILLNFLSDSIYLSSLKLQKMLFLFCQKYENKFYSFLPYKYGAFSFQANHDLYALENKLFWVKKDGKNYALTSYQNRDEIKVKENHRTEIESLKTAWLNKNEQDIIRYTYQKYPYYAIRSDLLNHINLADLKNSIQQQNPKPIQDTTIFTIGYEGCSVEEYFNILLKNNIKVLCDVRQNPVSRKYGFSQKALVCICKQFKILYEHIPSLGVTSSLRKNLETANDYAKLFKQYRSKILLDIESLNIIKELLNNHRRVALTCFEADIHCCHRKPLAEEISNMTGIRLKNL